MRTRTQLKEAVSLPYPTLVPFVRNGVQLPVNALIDNQPWIRSAGFQKTGYTASFEATSELAATSTRDTWNAFEHYTRTARLFGGVVELPVTIYDPGYWPNGGHTILYPDVCWFAQRPYHESLDVPPSGVVKLFDDTLVDGFVPTPSDWPARVSRMQGYLLNRAGADMSLLNSLYEIKDFKTLLPFVRRSQRLLTQYSDVLPKVFGPNWKHFKSFCQAFTRRFRNRRVTVMDVVRAAGEATLQWSFSLSPLIADLEAFEKAFSAASDRIDRIYRNSGIRRLVRYRADLPESVYASSDATTRGSLYERHWKPYPEGVPGFIDERTQVAYKRAVLHGQMEYTQYAPGLELRQAKLYALMDEWGVNLNPSIIWNGLPYSFLVDWLANVGTFLEQFKLENVRPVTVIHKCCYSLNVVRYTKRSVRYCAESEFDSGWRTASIVEEEAYRRFNDNLAFVGLPTTGLSKREFVIGSALVTAKWPRRKQRR